MRKKESYLKYYKRLTPKEDGSIVNRRYKILTVIIVGLFITLASSLFYVQIVKSDYYTNQLETMTQLVIEGDSAPRGRIYDRNGRIIVDNKAVKTIYYKKPTNISTSKEVKIAYQAAEVLKYFWVINNPHLANKKITDDEWQQLEERRISANDIENYKIERVTDDDLKEYQDIDREAAYIYYLMNKGYYYSEKTIKNVDVTDEEYALIASNDAGIEGFGTKLDWERYYPYGDVFRTLLGSVSSSSSGLPAELKDAYLAVGYSLSDRVGTSYLEYQYESILRGTKTKYTLDEDGNYVVLEEGKRGNDIVISIDIELQKAIEKIVAKELINTKKKDKYTKYFDKLYKLC